MQNVRMRQIFTQQQRRVLLWILLLCALVIKFFWPVFAYHMPLGYDVGIYRYLFIRSAGGFPPFSVVPLPEWAKGHPLGLLFFTTALLRAGMPIGWLLNWIWNLCPVALAMLLGWVMMRREGKAVGLLTMLAALLSVAYFDGFAAMYWETFAALFWCVLTYHLLERRSWIAIVTGILTVATHHQTGLIFGLAFASWVLIGLVRSWVTQKKFPREILLPLIAGIIVFAIGILWYLPVWKEAVLQNLPPLFAGQGSPGGNFPPASFYIGTEGILLAFGAAGFLLSFKRERFTLWQLSVLWCALFVVFQLYFFRRFFLQLDFFLLPFAAIALHAFWRRYPQIIVRSILILAIAIQLTVTARTIATRAPAIDAMTFHTIRLLYTSIPSGSTVIVPENQSAPFVQGWLPYDHIDAPGLFESAWSYDQWKNFITGTHENRLALLHSMSAKTYVFVSPYFRSYYGSIAQTFVSDPCFHPVTADLYSVVCR